MKLTQELLEEWRETPVGERFFEVVAITAEEAKQMWLQESWSSGVCDPQRLAELKGAADQLEQMRTVTAEEIEGKLHEKRERDSGNAVPGAGVAG